MTGGLPGSARARLSGIWLAAGWLAAAGLPCAASGQGQAAARVSVVLQQGDLPPGSDGRPVLFVGRPHGSGAGMVGITGVLDDDGVLDPFVWIDGRVVWRADTAAGTYSAVKTSLGISPLALDPLEAVPKFVAIPRDAGSGIDTVYSHLGPVLVDGDPAPGLPPGAEITGFSDAQMTSGGRSYWRSTYETGPGPQIHLLHSSRSSAAGDVELVLAPGDLVDGLEIDDALGLVRPYQVSSNDRHHIQLLYVNGLAAGPQMAVYLDGRIVTTWMDANSRGNLWLVFHDVAINDGGDYLLYGRSDAERAVVDFNGEVLMAEGDVVGGIHLAPPAAVLDLTIDNRGRKAYLWVTAGFGPEYLFYDPDGPAPTRMVLQAPSEVDLDGDGMPDATLERFLGPIYSLVFGLDESLWATVVLIYPGGSLLHALVRIPLARTAAVAGTSPPLPPGPLAGRR